MRFFIFLLLSSTFSLFSQTNQWDSESVQQFIKTSPNKAEAYQQVSAHYLEAQQSKLALDYMIQAYQWNKLQGNPEQLTQNEFKLAQLYHQNNDPAEALAYALKVLSVFEKNEQDSLHFEANYLISKLYLEQKRLAFAKQYTQEVFEYGVSENKPYFLGRSYFLKALYEYQNGNHDQAKNFMRNAQKFFKQLNDKAFMSDTYFEFGQMYLNEKEYTAAKSHFELAFKNSSISKSKSRKVHILMAMAAIAEHRKDKQTSVKFYQQALDLAQEHALIDDEVEIYKSLIKISLDKNETEKANQYLVHYNQLTDSIASENRSHQMLSLNNERALKTKDQAIEHYQTELEASENTLYAISLISILLLFIFVLLLFNIKRRKKIAKQQQDLLKAKQELAQAELSQVKSEVDMKNEHLNSIAGILIDKNAQIKTLFAQIEELKLRSDHSSYSDEKVKMVDELLEFKILTEDDWHEFRKLYNQVYEGLQAKLKIEHPELTKSEVKLFMISKLNLNLSEASDLLAISPESVRKARYRLKKKLNLGETDLQDYITRF
ncbi:MAG: tetratricopeptide repeat protein [Flavobacteriales bacterium]